MLTDTLLQAIESYLRSDESDPNHTLRAVERNILLDRIAEAQRRTQGEEVVAVCIPAERRDRKPAFGRILVAIDHTEQAHFAIETAAQLAKELHSDLSLIHVVHFPPPTNPDLAYEQIEYVPLCLEDGQKLLDRVADHLEPRHVEKILREGDPVTEIVETATRIGADLIVMGTHGRGRFSAAIVGSVAQGVMRKAICPVLCVAHDSRATHADKTASTQVAERSPSPV